MNPIKAVKQRSMPLESRSTLRSLISRVFLTLLIMIAMAAHVQAQSNALVNQPMSSATFVNIYWDSSWNSDDPSLPMATIDQVTQAILNSSYTTGLSEYGVNSVSFAGSFLPDSHCVQQAPNSIGFYNPFGLSIAGFIQCEHDYGPDLFRQPGVVYNIILPPSSIESDFWTRNFCTGTGSPAAWHYHGLQNTPPWPFGRGPFSGNPIYTIIQANPQCGGNDGLFDSLFHEMVEAMTDPYPVDISIIPPHINIAAQNEIADLCEGNDVTTFLSSASVMVPSYWSNQKHSCVNFVQRIGVVENGNLFVKEGALNAAWVWESSNVKSFALEGDRIGVLQNDGNLYVKEGPLDAPWTWESWPVQNFSLSGDRIGVLDNGTLYVKEGPLDASWTAESWNVQSFALEGNRIGVVNASPDHTLWVKEGPLTAAWTDETWNVQSFALAGDRIGVVNASPDHTLWVKEGPLTAGWTNETWNVHSFALAGDRIAVLNASPDHTLWVKEGPLTALWTAESSNVQSFALVGNRIAILDGSDILFVKEGTLSAGLVTEAGMVQSFTLSY